MELRRQPLSGYDRGKMAHRLSSAGTASWGRRSALAEQGMSRWPRCLAFEEKGAKTVKIDQIASVFDNIEQDIADEGQDFSLFSAP